MLTKTVNGDNVPERAAKLFNNIIRPWLVKSGSPAASITQANWKTKPLLLKFAPFKLLAIVNRLDLRGNSGYSFSNSGEGRFVFGALTSTCNPLQFTVIFEYGVNKKKCTALHGYADQWFALRNKSFGTDFNNDLQAITDQFTGAGSNSSRPNGSSLNQLRTNEIGLGNPWELREFKLNGSTHLLDLATVTREPNKKYNGRVSATIADKTLLAGWVNAHAATILNDTYTIPLTLPTGQDFLGGKAHTEGVPPPTHFWDADATVAAAKIIDDNVRHLFSLNTCSGCHGGEGKTPSFTHVFPVGFGTQAGLSGFLTGKGADANPADNGANEDDLFYVKDPANRPTAATATLRGFNDLQRRLDNLTAFVNAPCASRVFQLAERLRTRPLNMTH